MLDMFRVCRHDPSPERVETDISPLRKMKFIRSNTDFQFPKGLLNGGRQYSLSMG